MSTRGFPVGVEKYMKFMSDMHEIDELAYRMAIGAWLVHQVKGKDFMREGQEEVLKQMDEINCDIGNLLISTIEDYVKNKIKEPKDK